MLLAILICTPLTAEETEQRPKIGLALSGGGMKAGAHIGVLRVLEANHVPIDYIAGTSAGAIIGGLYASGLTPDEIEAAIRGIDWDDILQDTPARRDLPFRRKRDDLNFLVKNRPGFSDGKLEFPMGLVQGQKVTQFLRRQLDMNTESQDFDALPIPLRIVTTDLISGRAVVIGSGDLALAIRASMSIPVFLAPTNIDGQRLIDGGPSNNLPIEVVRELGADIVIAVDITAPLLTDNELDSVWSVADQMTTMLTQRNVLDSIALLSPHDILIRPQLVGFGGLDFDKTLDTMVPGEIAANDALPALTPLALEERAYNALMTLRRAQPNRERQYIQFIEMNNESAIGDDVIMSSLGFGIGDIVDPPRIEQGIARVYGLRLFEQIDYQIVERESQTGLVIDIIPQRWGPNYLQFGLQLAENFSLGSEFNVGIAYLQTATNKFGGEWRAQLDLGERQGVSVDWFQPLGYGAEYFVEAEALVQRRDFRFFGETTAPADLRVEGWGANLSVGKEIGVSGEFRAGWNRFVGDANVTVGLLDAFNDSIEIGEFYSAFTYDRLDSTSFPRDGSRASIQTFWSRKSAGANIDFEQVRAALFTAKSWGENTVITRFEAGSTRGADAPLQNQFLLGGLGRLSGYPANRFAGQHYGLGSVTAFRRLHRSRLAPWYAGLSIEAGNVVDSGSLADIDNALFAGALYLGAETPLGPFYVAWGWAEGGENTLYLYLGNPFVSGGARALD